MNRLLAAGSWIAATLMAGGQSGAQPMPGYRITGTVVDADSGRAVPNIHVIISVAGKPSSQRLRKTGTDGRFEFEGVSEGKWVLAAEGRRYPRQSFGSKGPVAAGSVAIVTGPQLVTEGLALKIRRGGTIAGKVVDEDQEPVVSAYILVHLVRTIGGIRQAFQVNHAYTNTNGEYAVGGLVPGQYYISATARPWYAEYVQEQSGKPVFLPCFYPGVHDGSAAQPVEVSPGQEANADLVMRTATSVSVALKDDGKPAQVRLSIEGVANSILPWPVETPTSPGVYRVPPGRYRAWFNAGTPSAQRIVPFEVGPSDTEIDLGRSPAGSIEARFDSAGIPPEQLTRAMLQLVDERLVALQVRQMPADGRIKLDHLSAGRYRLFLSKPPGSRFAIGSIDAGESRLADGWIQLNPGQNLQITIQLLTGVGTLKGSVMREGLPVAGAYVLALPRNRKDLEHPNSFVTDSDGSFEFTALRAGEYGVYCAAEDPEAAYLDPAVAGRLMEKSKPAVVSAGKATELKFELP